MRPSRLAWWKPGSVLATAVCSLGLCLWGSWQRTAPAMAQDGAPAPHGGSAQASPPPAQARGGATVGVVSAEAGPAAETATTTARPCPPPTEEQIELALIDPNTPLTSVNLRLEYFFYDGDLATSNNQHSATLALEPVVPIPIARTRTESGLIRDQILFRPKLRFAFGQPVPDPITGRFHDTSGFEDLGYDLDWARTYPQGLIIGGGITGSIPIGLEDLGTHAWTIGPEALVGLIRPWGVLALFPSQQWNIGGHGETVSLTTVQPTALFALGQGWSFGTNGRLYFDWQQAEWLVPLQLQAGKTFLFGNFPLRVAAEANYYVARPSAFSPLWMLRLTVQPVLPNILSVL